MATGPYTIYVQYKHSREGNVVQSNYNHLYNIYIYTEYDSYNIITSQANYSQNMIINS